ncbi:MAG: SprT family zinc-dependent metalloprotease [Anaerosomatales bacterium]|nr:SprT family zinc-dependent metalloprotease [Anaerosomatales bacterium]MDT8434931.1 SprT family zinc-dependent metalloprotease [Anaerosomatales bacterium]
MSSAGGTGSGASAEQIPAYAVRRSTRARRVRLTVTARDGLVVTLPVGVAERHAHRAVSERVAWATRALAEVADRREEFLAGPEGLLPDLVDLPVASRTVPVVYAPVGGAPGTAVARERGGVLFVTGDVDPSGRLAALRRWRDRTARSLLPALTHDLAAETGIEPARIAVRGQRTRWGSASARGTVSLNRNLIFLPPHLVRYVLAHELAHLRHLDHSPRFWTLLESMVPSAEEARAELRGARHLVPAWADE